MRTMIWGRFGLLFLLCIVVAPLLTASADGETWVRVRPAGGNYLEGGRIDVEVWIEDVQDLYGADVRLTFDTTRLAVVDADPTAVGVQLEQRDDLLSPDFVLRNQADNEAGTIWYAATQLNPTEPASGSGALFAFAFRALDTGLVSVDVSQWQLARRDGSEILAEATGASYQIEEGYRMFVPFVVANH